MFEVKRREAGGRPTTRRMTVYGFDVKDRGKDGQGASAAAAEATEELESALVQEQRRQRAAQFLASVDVSMRARRARRSSGVMW